MCCNAKKKVGKKKPEIRNLRVLTEGEGHGGRAGSRRLKLGWECILFGTPGLVVESLPGLAGTKDAVYAGLPGSPFYPYL